MTEPELIYVVVARTIHGEGKAGWWRPVGYATSLEEADAALNQLLEAEREALHSLEDASESEYEVWNVKDVWGEIESPRA